MHSTSLPTTLRYTPRINSRPADELTASSKICLEQHLRQFTGGRYEVTLDECFASLRQTFPILGQAAERKHIAQALRKLGFLRHRGRKHVAYVHRDRLAADAAEHLPAHLNFSFPDWIKQRTEPSRQPTGWTPLSVLYADYRAWCEATSVPASYIHPEAEFSGKLRAHSDREPETRPVERRGLYEAVVDRKYELCFPRFLRPAIRLTA